MKIIIASDSFKGTLKATDACRIIADGIVEVVPDADVIVKPMADGGEGTAVAMMASRGGQWIERSVMGPLPDMRVEAGFAWFEEDESALVEMASASGLELLTPNQMNPLNTTTYGTGELIEEAVQYGAGEVLLAIGGSATVDGGVGAASALGWRFLDEDGRPVAYGGGPISGIFRIIAPDDLNLPPVRVLCDVDNPLCGQNGAARVYAPQKGADAAMVQQLEHNLEHLAHLVSTQIGPEIADLPGGGAAGGLGAGAAVFMNGRIVSGIETILHRSGLEGELASADWIITGEGCFDEQSLRGKVAAGVAGMAREYGVRVGVIAGQLALSESAYRQLGIHAAVACSSGGMSEECALSHAAECLRLASHRFAGRWLQGTGD